ncbi:MAG: hypothetical protein IT320_19220 [Anaerolineae bacterium]|nr:hypothetical protein [Anaerolineae bacterium]
MHFDILDVERIYRRLLAAPDDASREAIFDAELVAPFDGLARIMGGSGRASFAQWGMTPALFGGEMAARVMAYVDALAAADAWGRFADALNLGWRAFSAYHDRITLDKSVAALLLADMSNAPWARGYAGFGAIPGWLMVSYWQPDAYNLARVEAATVHELHHQLMGASLAAGGVNMMASLADYMLGEGLAESFATELYGEDVAGPWVTDFPEAELARAKAIYREALDLTGFDTLRAYIFGGQIAAMYDLPQVDVPRMTGYALGYKIVQAYRQRTGKSVVDISFVPPREVIAESGFFG